MSQLRPGAALYEAGGPSTGKDRVDPGRSAQPVRRGAGRGDLGLPGLRQAGVLPGPAGGGGGQRHRQGEVPPLRPVL